MSDVFFRLVSDQFSRRSSLLFANDILLDTTSEMGVPRGPTFVRADEACSRELFLDILLRSYDTDCCESDKIEQ